MLFDLGYSRGVTKIEDISSLSGKFLVASPIMSDERFKKAVVFICEFKPANVFGFYISPIGLCSKLKILRNTIFNKETLYSGGFVDPGKLFLIHSCDTVWKTTFKISDVAITPLMDVLKNADAMPKMYMAVAGYTSWQKHQLEREIALGFWIAYDHDSSFIFDTKQSRWKDCMSALDLNENTFACHLGTS